MATAMEYELGMKLIKDFTFYQYIDKATGKQLLENVPVDVASGKAVPIFIYATEKEWSQEYVEVGTESVTLQDAEVRHCVCIIPQGDFTKDGKKWLTVQDSAKFGGRGMRYVEYDTFFLNRCYFASKVYATDTLPVPVTEIIMAKPTTPCALGDRNIAVLYLQQFLVNEGKLAPEYATRYYGAITAKAVLWWQLEHWNEFDVPVPKLLEWNGQYWGEGSIKIINK